MRSIEQLFANDIETRADYLETLFLEFLRIVASVAVAKRHEFVGARTNRRIVANADIFARLHCKSLFAASFTRLDRRIAETLARRLRMTPHLQRRKAFEIRIVDVAAFFGRRIDAERNVRRESSKQIVERTHRNRRIGRLARHLNGRAKHKVRRRRFAFVGVAFAIDAAGRVRLRQVDLTSESIDNSPALQLLSANGANNRRRVLEFAFAARVQHLWKRIVVRQILIDRVHNLLKRIALQTENDALDFRYTIAIIAASCDFVTRFPWHGRIASARQLSIHFANHDCVSLVADDLRNFALAAFVDLGNLAVHFVIARQHAVANADAQPDLIEKLCRQPAAAIDECTRFLTRTISVCVSPGVVFHTTAIAANLLHKATVRTVRQRHFIKRLDKLVKLFVVAVEFCRFAVVVVVVDNSQYAPNNCLCYRAVLVATRSFVEPAVHQFAVDNEQRQIDADFDFLSLLFVLCALLGSGVFL